MSVVSRMVERHRDTTFDKERLYADIAASWLVRSLQWCHWSETVRRPHAEPTRSRLARWRRAGGVSRRWGRAMTAAVGGERRRSRASPGGREARDVDLRIPTSERSG